MTDDKRFTEGYVAENVNLTDAVEAALEAQDIPQAIRLLLQAILNENRNMEEIAAGAGRAIVAVNRGTLLLEKLVQQVDEIDARTSTKH